MTSSLVHHMQQMRHRIKVTKIAEHYLTITVLYDIITFIDYIIITL